MKQRSFFLHGFTRTVNVALAAVFLLLGFSGGAAVAQNEGKVVKEIEVQYVGAAVVSKDRILANMSTKVGDQLSAAKIDEDIKNLYSSGIIENIKVLAKPAGGNDVKLLVIVQTRSILGKVGFKGNTIFDSEKLEDVVGLRVGESIDEAKVREGRTEIQERYRKRGYTDATVSYETSAPDRQGYSTVTYSINEGGKGILREVNFVGNTVFSASELRKLMEQRPKSILNPFAKTARLDDSTLEADIRAIEDFYQNKGFLSARVLNVSRVRADDGEHVDLVITIEEGPAYSVSSVSLEGMSAISVETEINPYLQTRAGGAYSGDALKNDIKLIEEAYGRKGYADSRVVPKLDQAGSNAVKITFNVSEGRSFNVGQIHIEGNIKTKDEVIRRELPVFPGKPFDTTAIEAARRRLMNMNYFHTVDIIPQDTGGYLDEKDLVITVTERPTGTINFGAGFSSIDDLVGFVEVSQTNFDIGNWPSLTGGGQRFRMSARVGTSRKDFIISLTEPWFMGYRLATTGEFFYRELNFLSDDYDQRNVGGALRFRKNLAEFTDGVLSFQPQNVEITTDADASEAILAEGGDFFYNAIGLDLIRDKRDDLFLPRKGYRTSLGAEQGVGGDVDATTLSAQGSIHFELPGDTIFNLAGKYTNVSNADQIFVREFLGGANNLRGFDFREVGPKDATGEPLGGDDAWYLTAEVTVPLVPKIRLAGFYDVGEVSGGPGTFGGGVNSNYGIGVRLFILGGAPVRLDYGIPIDGDEFNDNGGQFNFTIGYQF